MRQIRPSSLTGNAGRTCLCWPRGTRTGHAVLGREEAIMSRLEVEEAHTTIPMPSLSLREFLVGMVAMSVLNWTVILCGVCSIPLVLLFIVGVSHPSILKLHTIFALSLIVAISLGFNVVQLGLWCMRNLFASVNDRIVIGALLFWCNILLARWGVWSYLDIVLVIGLIGFAVWDKVFRREETG
jgi:hypothetical protein